jgi:hypothetical protein
MGARVMPFDDAWLQTVLARGQVRVIGEKPPSVAQEPFVSARMSTEKGRGVAQNLEGASGQKQGLPLDRYKSKTEARFATECLAPWAHEGRIEAWAYEAVTLVVAPGLRYTPDFLGVAGAQCTFWEIKGSYIRDRALHKVRMAAVQFPYWHFMVAQWKHQLWHYTLLRAE